MNLTLAFLGKWNTIPQSRAEQSRAEQSRAEQSRAEQSRAEQSRAEQSRFFFFSFLSLGPFASFFGEWS
jgi:hypothetical protein